MWAPGNPMPLDAATYQNMNHGDVDWASLAQQWLKMKEVHETVVINVPGTATPNYSLMPPSSHVQTSYHQPSGASLESTSVVGGEAPMDVEEEGSDITWSTPMHGELQPPFLSWSQHFPVYHQRPMFHQVARPGSRIIPPVAASPQIFYHAGGSHLAPNFPRVSLPSTLPPKQQGNGEEDVFSTPSLAPTTVDALKRKNLPAWIREGLEKMERDKQKKEERERFLQERELRRKTEFESNQLSNVAAATRSRFDDSSDEDEHQDIVKEKGRSESRDAEQDSEKKPKYTETVTRPSERLQNVMVIIRQLMTEVLLEVTTEEIFSVAVEVFQDTKVKIRQASSSLSSKSLTRALGLDQYGSDSDSEPNKSDQEFDYGKSASDSETDNQPCPSSHNVGAQLERLQYCGQIDNNPQQREQKAPQASTIAFQAAEQKEGKISPLTVGTDIGQSLKEGTKVDTDLSGKIDNGQVLASFPPVTCSSTDSEQMFEMDNLAPRKSRSPFKSITLHSTGSVSSKQEKKSKSSACSSIIKTTRNDRERSRSRSRKRSISSRGGSRTHKHSVSNRRSHSRNRSGSRRRSRSRNRSGRRRRSRSRNRSGNRRSSRSRNRSVSRRGSRSPNGSRSRRRTSQSRNRRSSNKRSRFRNRSESRRVSGECKRSRSRNREDESKRLTRNFRSPSSK